MKVAVLSGKGGAGKTLVSVNLAAVAGARYVDADVEEPNGHLFLPSKEMTIDPVEVLVPVVDEARCTACRECVDFCRFNALAMINDRVAVFEQVCTSCGGCTVLCPEGAISEKRRLQAKVLASSIVRSSETRAEALVFLDQLTTQAGNPNQASFDQRRVVVTLVFSEGKWLVSKTEAL